MPKHSGYQVTKLIAAQADEQKKHLTINLNLSSPADNEASKERSLRTHLSSNLLASSQTVQCVNKKLPLFCSNLSPKLHAECNRLVRSTCFKYEASKEVRAESRENFTNCTARSPRKVLELCCDSIFSLAMQLLLAFRVQLTAVPFINLIIIRAS